MGCCRLVSYGVWGDTSTLDHGVKRSRPRCSCAHNVLNPRVPGPMLGRCTTSIPGECGSSSNQDVGDHGRQPRCGSRPHGSDTRRDMGTGTLAVDAPSTQHGVPRWPRQCGQARACRMVRSTAARNCSPRPSADRHTRARRLRAPLPLRRGQKRPGSPATQPVSDPPAGGAPVFTGHGTAQRLPGASLELVCPRGCDVGGVVHLRIEAGEKVSRDLRTLVGWQRQGLMKDGAGLLSHHRHHIRARPLAAPMAGHAETAVVVRP